MARLPLLLAAAPLAVALLAPLALAAPAPADAPPPSFAPGPAGSGEALAASLAARTTGEGARRHLAAFQRIADASEGNRAAGTPGHERSAAYAGALLERAGYRVTYQRFDFPYREPLTERLTVLGPESREVEVRVLSYSPRTEPGGTVAALAAAAGPGTGCSPADFSPAAHRGRIALITRGTCTFAEKLENAAAAGAVGALFANSVPGELRGTLGAEGAIPAGGVSQEDGRALAAELATGREVTVRLELEELAEERSTVNVLAETRGGDPSRVVMAGAHLDSVPDGPGINDNGSGAAGVLETALRLAEADPAGRHPHRVRFALWSAEEAGLLGSEHYVGGLEESEREDIALYLNFDMIGSPNYGLFVYDSPVAEELSGFLGARGLETSPTPFNGRSDYGPFVAAGIPAGGTFTGAEGLKSPEEAGRWGGSAGEAYDPCYHRSCDDLDNVSAAALDANVRVIAHAVGRYAWESPPA